MLSLTRCLTVAWVITWVTVVPLFHTHIPDNTDPWSALHSGGAHTVLTPDLPGEFLSPVHHTNRGPNSQFSHRIVNSPELGIALFNEQSDLQTTPSRYAPTPLLPELILELPEKYWQSQTSQLIPVSRAPPRMMCV